MAASAVAKTGRNFGHPPNRVARHGALDAFFSTFWNRDRIHTTPSPTHSPVPTASHSAVPLCWRRQSGTLHIGSWPPPPPLRGMPQSRPRSAIPRRSLHPRKHRRLPVAKLHRGGAPTRHGVCYPGPARPHSSSSLISPTRTMANYPPISSGPTRATHTRHPHTNSILSHRRHRDQMPRTIGTSKHT